MIFISNVNKDLPLTQKRRNPWSKILVTRKELFSIALGLILSLPATSLAKDIAILVNLSRDQNSRTIQEVFETLEQELKREDPNRRIVYFQANNLKDLEQVLKEFVSDLEKEDYISRLFVHAHGGPGVLEIGDVRSRVYLGQYGESMIAQGFSPIRGRFLKGAKVVFPACELLKESPLEMGLILKEILGLVDGSIYGARTKTVYKRSLEDYSWLPRKLFEKGIVSLEHHPNYSGIYPPRSKSLLVFAIVFDLSYLGIRATYGYWNENAFLNVVDAVVTLDLAIGLCEGARGFRGAWESGKEGGEGYTLQISDSKLSSEIKQTQFIDAIAQFVSCTED